jgi:hypothetical protein
MEVEGLAAINEDGRLVVGAVGQSVTLRSNVMVMDGLGRGPMPLIGTSTSNNAAWVSLR